MTADLGDASAIEGDDFISIANRIQAISDDQSGATLEYFFQGLLYQVSASASTDELASSRIKMRGSARIAWTS